MNLESTAYAKALKSLVQPSVSCMLQGLAGRALLSGTSKLVPLHSSSLRLGLILVFHSMPN
jgi:hypothetical protein